MSESTIYLYSTTDVILDMVINDCFIVNQTNFKQGSFSDSGVFVVQLEHNN